MKIETWQLFGILALVCWAISEFVVRQRKKRANQFGNLKREEDRDAQLFWEREIRRLQKKHSARFRDLWNTTEYPRLMICIQDAQIRICYHEHYSAGANVDPRSGTPLFEGVFCSQRQRIFCDAGRCIPPISCWNTYEMTVDEAREKLALAIIQHPQCPIVRVASGLIPRPDEPLLPNWTRSLVERQLQQKLGGVHEKAANH